jgi:hypothetical protein
LFRWPSNGCHSSLSSSILPLLSFPRHTPLPMQMETAQLRGCMQNPLLTPFLGTAPFFSTQERTSTLF